MKIASTDLALHSDHAARMRDHRSESLRAWRGEQPNFEAQRPTGGQSVFADISTEGRQMLSATPASPSSSAIDPVTAAREALENDPTMILIRRMLMFFLGKDSVVDFVPAAESASPKASEAPPVPNEAATTPAAAGEANWGIEYDYHAVHEEFETTRFTAEGIVRTADGQEISFKLDIEMTRYYREETNISLRAGDAVRKDPLVVNFDGAASQLAGQANRRFSFDLNGDGKAEILPLFASGSGYLALDLNGNDRIDSGKELFGPHSGNGFAELALLDSDGNGWIDENDKDFNRLGVWTPAAEGSGKLQSLTDLGIGALSLAHVDTPFSLRGDDNSDLGIIKSSGLYLTESGQTGALQEIDLTV